MPPPRMPARDERREQAAGHQDGGAAEPELRRIDRCRRDRAAIAASPIDLVSRHRVADDERHRHREPARERVAVDERSVGRRSGVIGCQVQ